MSLQDLYLERIQRCHSTPITYSFGEHILHLYQNPSLSKRSFIDPKYSLIPLYLEKIKLSLQGKKILDLYSGIGLHGLICSLCDAKVTFCEEPRLVPLLESNLKENLPHYTLMSSEQLLSLQEKFDVILIHELDFCFPSKFTTSKVVHPYENIKYEKQCLFETLTRLSTPQTKVIATMDTTNKPYFTKKDVKLAQTFSKGPNALYLIDSGKVSILQISDL
jgi:hypothetical protein